MQGLDDGGVVSHIGIETSILQQVQLSFCKENAMSMVTVQGRFSTRCNDELDCALFPAGESNRSKDAVEQVNDTEQAPRGRINRGSTSENKTRSNERRTPPKRPSGWWRECM